MPSANVWPRGRDQNFGPQNSCVGLSHASHNTNLIIPAGLQVEQHVQHMSTGERLTIDSQHRASMRLMQQPQLIDPGSDVRVMKK